MYTSIMITFSTRGWW